MSLSPQPLVTSKTFWTSLWLALNIRRGWGIIYDSNTVVVDLVLFFSTLVYEKWTILLLLNNLRAGAFGAFNDVWYGPITANTCRTIIDKTSQRLNFFYFYMNNILIGLIFDESVCVKRQFIFDFTSFSYLERFNLQHITFVRMVIAPKIQFFSLLLFIFEQCCLFPNQ